jgi:hypothetical protein
LTVNYWFIIVTAVQRDESPQAGNLRKIERKKEEIKRAAKGRKRRRKVMAVFFFFSVLNEEWRA